MYKGLALLLSGRTTEGLAYFEALPPDNGKDVMKLGGITLANAVMGREDKAQAGIIQLQENLQSDLMERVTHFLILCHISLGNEERVLQLIEQGLVSRLMMLAYLYVDPFLKPLHSNPRFQRSMQEIFGKDTIPHSSGKKYKKALLDITLIEKYKQQ